MTDKVWTEKDFAVMDWHDARIYSLSPPDEEATMVWLIDYIFRWEDGPDPPRWYFWVSPCVVKFKSVHDLKIDLSFGNTNGLYIMDIHHVGDVPWPNGKGNYLSLSVECSSGVISFVCRGFEQTVMKPPVRLVAQDFGSWTGG